MREKIEKTKEFIKNRSSGESSGHDWWHVHRVWRNALTIAEKEGGNRDIIELAALLHDVADYKLHGGDETIGPKAAREWLESTGVEENIILKVCEIIGTIDFKGGVTKNVMGTLEGKIVHDADKLDAIGAIGIARAFTMGAKFNEIIYDPNINISSYKTAEEYVSAQGKEGRTIINHFYEKLLLLKDRMNTKTGREMAEDRHKVMEKFLHEFYKEWEGKK